MRTESLELRLRAFRLPSFLAHYAPLAEQAAQGGRGHVQYLDELAALEATERGDRRIARLLKEARLPREKTLATLDPGRFPAALRTSLGRLAQGEFLEGATNLCIFGNPGVGKTHVMAAIGHELVRAAQAVLFTLLAERYERKSVMITSNLVFSKWDQIFKDPMTTAAAIDRVVHHSVILELTVPSYRAEAARRRVREKPTKAV